MKTKKHLLFAFCAVLSCGGCSDGKGPQDLPDAKTIPPRETCFGTYTGTLPGADCPGIETTLTLLQDSTFQLRMVYIDRETSFEEEGRFFQENDTLLAVQSKNGHRQYYRIEQGSLRHLDADKNAIAGALADRYVLTKKSK